MSKSLGLSLKRVKCNEEQSGEWGKDEMYLVGYGVTGGGNHITIRPTSLGSYGTGDVRDQGWTLVDTQVSDGDNSAAFCIWLFEHDDGHLKDKGLALENWFTREYAESLVSVQQSGLPAQSRIFYAFAQAMATISLHMMRYASEGVGRADDLLRPRFHNLIAELPALDLPGGTSTFELIFQDPELHAGPTYSLKFEYSFRAGVTEIHP